MLLTGTAWMVESWLGEGHIWPQLVRAWCVLNLGTWFTQAAFVLFTPSKFRRFGYLVSITDPLSLPYDDKILPPKAMSRLNRPEQLVDSNVVAVAYVDGRMGG